MPCLAPSGRLTISTSGTSAGDYLPGDRALMLEIPYIVRLSATKDSWVAFGNGSATASASSTLFLKGTETFKLPDGCNFIAAITVDGTAGTLSAEVMT